MRILFLSLASFAAADPLPKQIQPAKPVIEVMADEDGRKVWHTRFFRIDSDIDLRPNELARLARVADTTALVIQAHPLPLFAPPEGRRPRISIYSADRAYREAGGAPGSSGTYTARDSLVVIHGGYFTRPPGAERSRLDPGHDEALVVHEIVHLCMHRVNRGLPTWFTEGIAEYFACAHTGAGQFSFTGIDAAIRRHLRVRLSPDNPEIPLVPVTDVAGLDGRGWLAYVTALPVDRRYHAYATSLLLAHFFLHGGEGRIQEVRSALTAAPRARKPAPMIRKEDAAAIQDALIRYWRPRGLTLRFAPEIR